jgi:hypothetical protein
MKPEVKKRYIEPNFLHLVARGLIYHMLRIPAYFPFSTEVSVVENSISRANQLFDEGYGCLLNITHFSKLDALQMIVWPSLLSSQIFKRPLVVPMELRQSQQMHGFLVKIAPMLGITIFPIVIDDTIKYIDQQKISPFHKNGKKIVLGDNVPEYLRATRQALADCAVVGMAPQMGRRSTLEPLQRIDKEKLENTREPIRALVGSKNELKKVFFLFMSMSLKGKPVYAPNAGIFVAEESNVDYAEEKDKYSTKGYDIRLGPVVTHEEAMALAKMQNITLDEWIINMHSLQVDPRYRKTDYDSNVVTFNNYFDMFQNK